MVNGAPMLTQAFCDCARTGETLSLDAGTHSTCASGLLHLEAAGHRGELLVDGQFAAVGPTARIDRSRHCASRSVAFQRRATSMNDAIDPGSDVIDSAWSRPKRPVRRRRIQRPSDAATYGRSSRRSHQRPRPSSYQRNHLDGGVAATSSQRCCGPGAASSESA